MAHWSLMKMLFNKQEISWICYAGMLPNLEEFGGRKFDKDFCFV